MTNTELKEKIINFYDSHELFTKPKGETFYISNIGTTKIGNDVKEAFQYSGQGKFVPFDTIYKCYDKILQDNKLTREWFETTFPIEKLNFHILLVFFVVCNDPLCIYLRERLKKIEN